MDKQKLARLVSIILGPHVWFPLLLILFLSKSGLSSYRLHILFPSLFLLQVIIPLSYLYLAVKLHWAAAWDLPNRHERYAFIGLTLACYIVSLVLVHLFGSPLLFHLSILLLVNLVVIAVITFFWKISWHTGINTIAALLVNFLFGWQLPWLYLVVPIIFWARIVLRRHTLSQLLAGFGVCGAITLWGLHLFSYI